MFKNIYIELEIILTDLKKKLIYIHIIHMYKDNKNTNRY